MKNLLALIIILITSSCSMTDADGCSNWYYVYTYDDCSCALENENCQTYHLLNEENYNCLNTLLLESSDSCVYVDNTNCETLTFSGYIRVLEKDCFKIDIF